MVLAPHTDPSESRYAEIARKMVETGDWITPQFDYGVPFWAKPPLSMWMSALGIEFFGANGFGSRIFIFLSALGILWLVADSARRELGPAFGRVAAALLMGMPLFFYCSAAVMTDLALLLGTTLAMVGFHRAVRDASKLNGYLFFAGLAIGLLAKGPLALVVALPPVFGWMLLTGRWKRAWTCVPWISGGLLMLLIAVPWYLLAERKTPGFLEYFIVGEHWKRFTERGWEGDLYGNAHAVPPAMIWPYALIGAFPWCLGFLMLPFRRWRELKGWAMQEEGRGLYWLLWALWPICFFTPARNIIATYPLPALPAMALLLTEITRRRSSEGAADPLHPGMMGLSALFVLWAVAASTVMPSLSPKHSERELVRRFRSERTAEDHLIYYGSRKFSAEFYSEGAVDHTTSPEELKRRIDAPGRLFVAVPSRLLQFVPAPIRRRLSLVEESWDPAASLYVEKPDIPEITGIDPSRTLPIGN